VAAENISEPLASNAVDSMSFFIVYLLGYNNFIMAFKEDLNSPSTVKVQ
jgi:hypothetical protein